MFQLMYDRAGMPRRPFRCLFIAAVVSAVYLMALDGSLEAARGGAGAAVAHVSSAPKTCGRVRALGTTFNVDVLAGRVRCQIARRVIDYVLTHGKPTQGSPGTSPLGWLCGYGYGFYHGHHEQSGRAGPSCRSGSKIVQGTQDGYTLNSS